MLNGLLRRVMNAIRTLKRYFVTQDNSFETFFSQRGIAKISNALYYAAMAEHDRHGLEGGYHDYYGIMKQAFLRGDRHTGVNRLLSGGASWRR